MTSHFRRLMALVFSLIFFALSIALAGIAIQSAAAGLSEDKTLTEALLKALNMAVISLATFELGLGVHKEYAAHDEAGDILVVLRRTVSRFVSIVCIALVLEGLIMVIKYSQLELAGNLPYPVAIVTSAAVLLAALGVFLSLTRERCSEEGLRDTLAASLRDGRAPSAESGRTASGTGAELPLRPRRGRTGHPRVHEGGRKEAG